MQIPGNTMQPSGLYRLAAHHIAAADQGHRLRRELLLHTVVKAFRTERERLSGIAEWRFGHFSNCRPAMNPDPVVVDQTEVVPQKAAQSLAALVAEEEAAAASWKGAGKAAVAHMNAAGCDQVARCPHQKSWRKPRHPGRTEGRKKVDATPIF